MPTLTPASEEYHGEIINRLHAQPISVNYFDPDRAVTTDHVKRIFGERALSLDDYGILALTEAVAKQKKGATQWGKQNVQNRIIANLQELGLVEVQSWKDVQDTHKDDVDGRLLATYWNACYGMFEGQHSDWELGMETKYMTEVVKFEYAPQEKADGHTSETKGCFARLFVRCKGASLSSLRAIGRNSHGNEFKLKRTKEEMVGATRFKKRKKGETLGCFAVAKGEKLYDQKEMEAKEKKVSFFAFNNCFLK